MVFLVDCLVIETVLVKRQIKDSFEMRFTI
jgi:hypothetical protein